MKPMMSCLRGVVRAPLAAGLVAAAPALAQSKAEIQKLDDQWAYAFNTANAAAVAAMYTKDAYVLPAGGAMIHDHAAIEALWQGAMADMQDVQCTALDVKPLGGNAAREIGTCTFMTKKPPLEERQISYALFCLKKKTE